MTLCILSAHPSPTHACSIKRSSRWRLVTAVILQCFSKTSWVVDDCFLLKLFLQRAAGKEKWKVNYSTLYELLKKKKKSHCKVMDFSFVSDPFEQIHSVCHGVRSCRVKVQRKRIFLPSPTKVDLRASCFSLQIHLTNGNTFGTVLYLVSPWRQTVNH